MKIILKLALLSALSIHSYANAAMITIVNASFEDGSAFTNSYSGGSWMHGSFTGWTLADGDGGRYSSNGTLVPGAVDGTVSAWSDGATITQMLSDNLTAGTTYTLSVSVGKRNDLPFPGYTVDLLADGAALTGGTITTAAPSAGSWATHTYEYTATSSGGALGIRLASLGQQTNFDNVSLNAAAAVPEPETYAMFLAGLGLLGFASKRRKLTAL